MILVRVVMLSAGQLATVGAQAETVMKCVDRTVDVEIVGYTSTTQTLEVKTPPGTPGDSRLEEVSTGTPVEVPDAVAASPEREADTLVKYGDMVGADEVGPEETSALAVDELDGGTREAGPKSS